MALEMVPEEEEEETALVAELKQLEEVVAETVKETGEPAEAVRKRKLSQLMKARVGLTLEAWHNLRGEAHAWAQARRSRGRGKKAGKGHELGKKKDDEGESEGDDGEGASKPG